MSDTNVLHDAVSRVFGDFYENHKLNAARRAGWSHELWAALEETGVSLISVPESSGGPGGTLVEAADVLRLAGRFCAAVPLAETALLAGWALAAAQIPLVPGPLAFAIAPRELDLDRQNGGWRVSGKVRRVPYARHAAAVVLVAESENAIRVICAPRGSYEVTAHANVAGEARDDISFDGAVLDDEQARLAESITADEALQRGALARALQMSGALERILDLTLVHTRQRSQFGRPLIKFQAVQQELARLAGEAAIARASAMAAASRLMTQADAGTAIAVAKIRAGEAAQTGAGIAHQLHGAIGVTDEYLLHHSTLRLWAWRSEYGSEAYWAQRLGSSALARGSAAVWDQLTDSNR